MILIIGGACQGKREYAMKTAGLGENDIPPVQRADDCMNAEIITDYHLTVKKLMDENKDPLAFTRLLCRKNSSAVITMNEVGCGVIPIDAGERQWREAVGRCGCILAENSERVIRMFCGIPTVIKEKI